MTQSKKNALTLIIHDMRFCKLVNLLDKVNIEAYDYLPRIAEPVFELADLIEPKQVAKLKEQYYVRIQLNAEAVDVTNDDDMESRAEDIWKWIRMNR